MAGFRAAFLDAEARLGAAPAMWSSEPFGARGCRLKKYPYRLIYIEEPTRAFVVAIAHDKRRQGYWRRRLPP